MLDWSPQESSLQASWVPPHAEKAPSTVSYVALPPWAAQKLNGAAGYGTDEASFEQGAANLLVHGHDPYGANLLPTLAQFSTPTKYMTYTMTGGPRLQSLIDAVRYCERRGIPGDFAECGVWRGGSVMAIIYKGSTATWLAASSVTRGAIGSCRIIGRCIGLLKF